METLQDICDRWVRLLRHKAEYEHNARKADEVVASPSIDDICNEMEAFFTGLQNNECRARSLNAPQSGLFGHSDL